MLESLSSNCLRVLYYKLQLFYFPDQRYDEAFERDAQLFCKSIKQDPSQTYGKSKWG